MFNFPNYYLALAGKGRVRAAQGDFENAIKLLTDANNRVPNVETAILLGDIYTKQGNAEKAKQQYDLVEIIEQKIGVNDDQKRLAMLWADQNIKLDEALTIAKREHEMRKDIFTADTLAWVLYKKGNFAEAKKASAEAMRLKSNDARILYHAGMIEKELGNKTEAVKTFEKISCNKSEIRYTASGNRAENFAGIELMGAQASCLHRRAKQERAIA